MDSSELLRAILASAVDHAIIVCDCNGSIQLWNAGAERVFGYPADEVLGHNIELIFTESDRTHGVPERERRIAAESGRTEHLRWHRRRDGALFWAEGTMTPVRDASGTVVSYMSILCDATEKKRSEEEIVRLARVDALTGLANRSEFQIRLLEMTAAALRHDQLLILLLVDLDHFKSVNDRFGHAAGDQLLCQAAQRMRSAVRGTDFAARLGGDEFVVLQPDARCPEVGGTVADKLVDVLSRPFRVDGHELAIGASIGIAVFPRDATDPDQLLRKADLALYKVKAEARGGYHYFTEQLDYRAHKKSRDLAQLRRAVRRRAFALHYQPQVDCESGQVVAIEALLRCTDPLLSRFSTAEIVALASDAGLMNDIGLRALQEASLQMRSWRNAGLPPVRLCLNLCPVELKNPRFPGQLDTILAQAGLTPLDLEIEITERHLFEAEHHAMPIMAELRSRGVSVAIDDFGTGYSSLSHLSNLSVDKVKLDRSFIQDIPHDSHRCAVASAIVSLARTLNLRISIEGVESAAQARFFHTEHCEALQGYYFSRPLAAEEMGGWLARNGTQFTPHLH